MNAWISQWGRKKQSQAPNGNFWLAASEHFCTERYSFLCTHSSFSPQIYRNTFISVKTKCLECIIQSVQYHFPQVFGGAYLGSTLEMHSRHRESSNVHCDTAIQVQSPNDKKEPAPHDGPKGKVGRDRNRFTSCFCAYCNTGQCSPGETNYCRMAPTNKPQLNGV